MKNKKILVRIILCASIIITTIYSTNVFAHSGRTDKNGGHKDNKNASGLGSYHYHCGGYPAHLHENGVCPYKQKSSNSSNSSNSSTKKSNSTTSNKNNTSTNINKTTTNKNQTTVTKTNTITNNNTSENKNTTTNQSTETTKINEIVVEKIEIKTESNITELMQGNSTKLYTIITPENSTNKTITWTSSNNEIATVDSNGNVTAVSEGKVKISAKSNNGKTNSIELVIKRKPILVDNIKLDQSEVSMNVGDESKLEFTILPEDADNKEIDCSSSNNSVVKIDNNKIIAVSPGEAIITVSSKDGNSTNSCKVIVSEVKIEENYNNDTIENNSTTVSEIDSSNENDAGSAIVGCTTLALGGSGIYYMCSKKKKNKNK